MYMTHGTEKLPEDRSSTIWRYMDFTKFVYMLDQQALFFCRPDCLDDRFEGTWGKVSRQALQQELKDHIASGGRVFRDIDFQLEAHKRNAANMRQTIAVSCWHLNPHESAAMWKLYVYAHQGIAIRSTVSKLIESFPNDKSILIHVGMVNYIDFDSESIPTGNYLSPMMYKRKSFEHERELRAVACKAEITETDTSFSMRVLDKPFAVPGENVAIDLSVLIESIHLAPGSPTWMTQLITSVAKRYGLSVPVMNSKLDDDPA